VLIAARHLHPTVAVVLAVILSAAIVVYWVRLGRPAVPSSRRLVRRVSLGLMLLTLVPLVRGTGFLDPDVHHAAYLRSWAMVLLGVGAIVLTASIDAINSIRLIQRERQDLLQTLAAGRRDRHRLDSEPHAS